ncbi:MAG: radical SAM protein [Spirochaetaceae bacterium]|nr:radical SAM protein [Spirochaetaceae bacterium]
MKYKNCKICPRNCSIDRTSGKTGFCGFSDTMVISIAALHFGEEPPITGEGGSGTIFFSGCTMKCPFCQNWQISRGSTGSEVSIDKLVEIMIELQTRGAENINFVTGTHFIPSIKEAVLKARVLGLQIPLVWNCSGYESLEAVEFLSTFIDIYLPDFKTSSSALAKRLFLAEDYPQVAEQAILKMAEDKKLSFTETGKMKSGVIVRHLVLPGEIESSRVFLKWYSDFLIAKALISVMVQYTPVQIPGNHIEIPQRHVSLKEYNQLLDFMDEYYIEEGFFQDLETGSDWLPDFTKSVPFPSKQTKVIWSSIQNGFIQEGN